MPTIGDRTVNLFTVKPDETVYVGPTHTVSHKDKVTLRRTLADNKSKTQRTNMLFERGFAIPDVAGVSQGESPVTVSIAVTLAPGVTPAEAKAYIKDTLVQAQDTMSGLAISGDIHI